MKKILFICLFSVLASSCLRLDDNLFNPSKLNEYALEKYTGEVDFKLDSTYTIAPNLISQFPLFSQSENEASPTTIYAVYIGDIEKIATDTVIVYCHGNRDHMDFYWPRAKLLANINGKNNYGVLMFDYRGYGRSEGKATEQGMYADVNTALQWLKKNGLEDNRLILYGFSMGTAPATKVAANADDFVLNPQKLILEAPFASAEVMVQDASKLAIPGKVATDLEINNAQEIEKVQQPFLWIHGLDDDFLNYTTHGQVVYSHYKGSYKEAISVPLAGHSNIETVMGYKDYMKAVGNFIRRP